MNMYVCLFVGQMNKWNYPNCGPESLSVIYVCQVFIIASSAQVICKNKCSHEEADCAACVCTQQPYWLCLSGPKVVRHGCQTGAAWSQPRPQMPAEMLVRSLQQLSNPSLSPSILLDRVSSEHLRHTPIHHQPRQQHGCSGQLSPCRNVCRVSAVLSPPHCEEHTDCCTLYLLSVFIHILSKYWLFWLLVRSQGLMFFVFFQPVLQICELICDIFTTLLSLVGASAFLWLPQSSCSFRWTRPLGSHSFHCTQPSERHPRTRPPCCCRLPYAGIHPESPLKNLSF